jgi:hypothetical protein
MARKRTAKPKAKAKAKPTTKFVRTTGRANWEAPSPPRGGVSVGGNKSSRRTKAQAERIIAEAYQMVFSTPQGAVVLADLMQWCNVYNPVSEADPINLGIRIGERNVALRIAQMKGLRPEHFPTEAWATADTLNSIMAGA